jgi:methyl-accepting chemotaxis protein
MADQNLKIRIQAIDTTQRIFKAVARRLNSLRKTVFSFRTALVSLAGAGGFGFLIKSSMDSIDKISKLSRTLGISVADLRKLEFAADLSGLSVDTVARAVRNLNRVMVDFQGGTGDAKDSFDELGITSDDLNEVMGDQFKVLELLADRFERVENSAIRSSIAQDLFGGRASEMLLVLEEGADGLAQISDEAERFGLLLSASAAKGVEDANDSFTRLFALFKGLRDTVVSFLAPAIQMAVEAAQKHIEALIRSYDDAGGIKAFARDISLSLVNAIQSFD